MHTMLTLQLDSYEADGTPLQHNTLSFVELAAPESKVCGQWRFHVLPVLPAVGDCCAVQVRFKSRCPMSATLLLCHAQRRRGPTLQSCLTLAHIAALYLPAGPLERWQIVRYRKRKRPQLGCRIQHTQQSAVSAAQHVSRCRRTWAASSSRQRSSAAATAAAATACSLEGQSVDALASGAAACC